MAAFFALLLGSATLLMGYFLYDFGKQNYIRETEAAIDNEISHLLLMKGDNGADYVEEYIRRKQTNQLAYLYLFIAADGTIVTGNIEEIPSDVKPIKEGIIGFEVSIDGEHKQLAAKIHSFADGSRLVVARDVQDIIDSYQTLKILSALIISFMLIVVSVSFFISLFVVSRINRIARTAQHIMDTGDLKERITIDSNWDDLSNLSMVLNRMFARIDELLEGVRDVSDSIAHDLRTPLTRLRQHLEDVSEDGADVSQKRALILEADTILGTFNSLLRISNIEKGKRHQAFTKVSLNEILADMIDFYEPIADEKHVTLKTNIDDVPVISGDRHLLCQMMANILDNALKFSPDNTQVDVGLASHKKTIILTIADQGVGVAEEERENIFGRFYRIEKSRSHAGNGLGLSLVKAIADMHKATIELGDNQPGFIIKIIFKI